MIIVFDQFSSSSINNVHSQSLSPYLACLNWLNWPNWSTTIKAYVQLSPLPLPLSLFWVNISLAILDIHTLNQWSIKGLNLIWIESFLNVFAIWCDLIRRKFDYLLIILLSMLSNKAIVLNHFSNSLFVAFYINYSIFVSYLNWQNDLIVSFFISFAFLTIFLNISKFDTTICFDNI
jgi:hypothetical protein